MPTATTTECMDAGINKANHLPNRRLATNSKIIRLNHGDSVKFLNVIQQTEVPS